jgi:hypothetical protein
LFESRLVDLFLPGLVLALVGGAGTVIARRRSVATVDSLLIGAVSIPLSVALSVQLLGRIAMLDRAVLALLLLVAAQLAVALDPRAGPRPRAPSGPARRTLFRWRPSGAERRDLRSPFVLSIGAMALAALGAAFWSAAILETWAWDSLGYHLPIAHDAVQVGRLREVPSPVPYVETYPRFADLVTTGFRVLLGDERFVDLSQWPFLPILALACVRLGRHLGLGRVSAVAYGIAFVTVPIVYLQCATSYVDVAYAALLVAGIGYLVVRHERLHDVLATLFLGLAIATKPSGPGAVALAATAMVARDLSRGAFASISRTLTVTAGAMVLGGKVYLENLLRHGNPVWPVELTLGPWRFEGPVTQEHILGLQLSEAQRQWPWAKKLAVSWLFDHRPFAFDMRFGGLGIGFGYVVVPLALLAAWRMRVAREAFVVTACASLLQAGAFQPRYVIAFVAIAIVIAGAGIESLHDTHKRFARLTFAVALAVGAYSGHRGFSGGRASLAELSLMTPRERARVAALDSMGERWFDLRHALEPGEALAFDRSMGLPGLVFRPDGTSRLLYLGDDIPAHGELDAFVKREHVRFLAVRFDRVDRLGPGFVERLRSEIDDCVVFEVVRPPMN